ncbi:MAG TPA: hypothetical protein VEH29_06495 [Acidimicrobiales bacterium]|nr:hypothetical protein [Acidimicrobiales bacterium]
MSQPLYDLLLVAHVVVAVVGFGAIAAAGLAASSARGSRDPVGDEAVRRFFKTGPDWPARFVFGVPLLGLALLFGGDRTAVHFPWPWIGLSLWTLATGVATALCWPAEHSAQQTLVALQDASPEARDALLGQFREACQRMELAAGAISVCFVAAMLVMIFQP